MEKDLKVTVREYLHRQLPPEEKDAFEHRLAADATFAAAVAEEAALYTALEEEGNRHLALQLEQFSRELIQQEQLASGKKPAVTHRIPFRRVLLAAAILTGLLLVTLPMWRQWQKSDEQPTAQAIFTNHFAIPPVAGIRDAASEGWRRAFAAHDFQTAIELLNRHLSDPAFAGRSEAMLYLGVARLALNQPEAALPALQAVGKDSYDWELAQWYSALALLKLERQSEAKKVLSDIAGQAGHPKRGEAEAILGSLATGR